jgi:hypothetical protein
MSFFKKITKDFENLMGDEKKPKDEPKADQQRGKLIILPLLPLLPLITPPTPTFITHPL